MRFLEYDPSFPRWLVDYAGFRSILDVGAGEGHLLRDVLALSPRRPAIGIDFRALADEDVAPHMIFEDATEHPLCRMPGFLLVLARPCHGEWVNAVIRKAASEVLYLGRASRKDDDLGDLGNRLVTPVPVPGVRPHADGEPILAWSIRLPEAARHPDDLDDYWLVDRDERGDPTWAMRRQALGPRGRPWKPTDPGLGYWTSGMGSGCPAQARDRVLQGPVAVASERELDWSLAGWVQELLAAAKAEKYPSGWLAPDGTFHACAYYQHDTYAYYVLGFEVREIETLGWARVHERKDDPGGDPLFAGRPDGEMLTEAQAATVERLLVKFRQP